MVVVTELPGIAIRIIKDCLKEEIANQYTPLKYSLNVSIGYALWNRRVSGFKRSVAEADRMMYKDKRS